jgi:hypothetical protein
MTLSREEVEDLWERLLREERYEVVEFLSPGSSDPTSRYRTDNRTIKVMDGRAGYLWGRFGLSDGGRMVNQRATGGGRSRSGRSFATVLKGDHSLATGRLDKALDEAKARGWTVVDMKADWKKIYPFE